MERPRGYGRPDIEDGDVRLRLILANELATNMTFAFRQILDANPGAQNYVEQTVMDRETGQRYAFVVCRPEGKTPDQLRREAEADRDQLAAAVTAIAAELDQAAARAKAYHYRSALRKASEIVVRHAGKVIPGAREPGRRGHMPR